MRALRKLIIIGVTNVAFIAMFAFGIRVLFEGIDDAFITRNDDNYKWADVGTIVGIIMGSFMVAFGIVGDLQNDFRNFREKIERTK